MPKSTRTGRCGLGRFAPAAGAFIAGVMAAAACSPFGAADREYVIRLDSIVAPATHPADADLTIRLYGFVGPDGCHRLDRYEVAKTPSRLDLRAWGVEVRGDDVLCTQALVELDDSLQVQAPFNDPFVIAGRQPDGSELITTVEIQ